VAKGGSGRPSSFRATARHPAPNRHRHVRIAPIGSKRVEGGRLPTRAGMRARVDLDESAIEDAPPAERTPRFQVSTIGACSR